ncbi:hypothetical protein ACWEQL_10670 [Kitasatospora sp. NPDC004240]
MGLKDRFQEKAHELAQHARSALGHRSERATDAAPERAGRATVAGRAAESPEETGRELRNRPDETEGPW